MAFALDAALSPYVNSTASLGGIIDAARVVRARYEHDYAYAAVIDAGAGEVAASAAEYAAAEKVFEAATVTVASALGISALWREVQADAEALKAANNIAGIVVDLALAPLWSGGAPIPEIDTLWIQKKAALSERRDEHWAPWIEWYERCLGGRPLAFAGLTATGNEDFCISLATEGAAFWRRPVAVVNEEIELRLSDWRSKIGGYNASEKVDQLTPPMPERKEAGRSSKASAPELKSKSSKARAKTSIGRSALQNHQAIILQTHSINFLVQRHIEELEEEKGRLNDLDTIREKDREIDQLRVWLGSMQFLRENVDAYVKGDENETELAKLVRVYSNSLIEYIRENPRDVGNFTFKSAIVGAFTVFATLCGAGFPASLIAIGAVGVMATGKQAKHLADVVTAAASLASNKRQS